MHLGIFKEYQKGMKTAGVQKESCNYRLTLQAVLLAHASTIIIYIYMYMYMYIHAHIHVHVRTCTWVAGIYCFDRIINLLVHVYY